MPGYGGAASAGASVFGATGLDNQPPEEIVAIVTSMGFHRNQAVQALRATVSREPVCEKTSSYRRPCALLSAAVETSQWPSITLNHAGFTLYPTVAPRDSFAYILCTAKINIGGNDTV